MAKLVNKNQELKPDVITGLKELAAIIGESVVEGLTPPEARDEILGVLGIILGEYKTTPVVAGKNLTPREQLAVAQKRVANHEREMIVSVIRDALEEMVTPEDHPEIGGGQPEKKDKPVAKDKPAKKDK